MASNGSGDTDGWIRDTIFKNKEKSKDMLSFKKVYKSDGSTEVIVGEDNKNEKANRKSKRSKDSK